jgi:hypothetical protein
MLKGSDSFIGNDCNLEEFENDEFDDEDDEGSNRDCANDDDICYDAKSSHNTAPIDNPRKPTSTLTVIASENHANHKTKPSFSIDNIIGNRKKPRTSSTLANQDPKQSSVPQQPASIDETLKSNYFKQFFDQINYINQMSMNHLNYHTQASETQKVNMSTSTSSIDSNSSACISPSSSPSSLSVSSTAFPNRNFSELKKSTTSPQGQALPAISPLVDNHLMGPATAAALAAAAAAACTLYPQLNTNPLKQQPVQIPEFNVYRFLNDTLLMRAAANQHQPNHNSPTLFHNGNTFSQNDLNSLLPLYFPINT